MGEREALLRAVCENPDDDLPRLVFADWLDEHGEPERAEFIRVQIELARTMPNHDPCANDLEQRERQLWNANELLWWQELPHIEGVIWYSQFRGGFAETVTVADTKTLVTHAETLFNAAPIRDVRIERVRGLRAALQLPFTRRLTSLTLWRSGINDALAGELLVSPYLAKLQVLDLQENPISADMADHLRSAFGDRVHLSSTKSRRRQSR